MHMFNVNNELLKLIDVNKIRLTSARFLQDLAVIRVNVVLHALD